MTFTWGDYLSVARHSRNTSAENGYEEAFLRAAISRAYDAALHTARHFSSNQWGIEAPATAEIHAFAPKWFLNADNEEQREIGVLLGRLRDRRRKAD